jgi:hypothetical protein
MKTATTILLAIGILLTTLNAQAHESAGIVKAQITTVAPKRKAQLHEHQVQAPLVRTVWDAIDEAGCITRTLAGDPSGQRVRICSDVEPRVAHFDPDTI